MTSASQTLNSSDSYRSIIDVINDRAAAHPDAVALIDVDGSRVTYGELISLAHRIRGHFPTAYPRTVGVVRGRGRVMMASLIAVLASGASYMVFDAASDMESVSAKLKETEVDFVITTPALARKLPGVLQLHIVDDVMRNVEAGPMAHVEPDDIALYAMNIGNSGFGISHRTLSERAAELVGRLGVTNGEVVLDCSTRHAMLLSMNALAVLSGGGTLVIAPDRAFEDISKIIALAEAEGVTAIEGSRAVLGEITHRKLSLPPTIHCLHQAV